MKKIISIALALVLSLGLVACGGSSGSEPATPKDYAQIIHDARSAEFNEAFMTITPDAEASEGYVAMDGFAADYTEEGMLASYGNDMVLPLLGLSAEMYDTFSASVSMMMTNCYGVAIVDPAEGQTEAVQAALENFVTSQQMAFEFYLADQYEIALTGTVTVADSGEVVLVCCQDGAAVQASILEALAA